MVHPKITHGCRVLWVLVCQSSPHSRGCARRATVCSRWRASSAAHSHTSSTTLVTGEWVSSDSTTVTTSVGSSVTGLALHARLGGLHSSKVWRGTAWHQLQCTACMTGHVHFVDCCGRLTSDVSLSVAMLPMCRRSFSEIVNEARASGYTEPDPRDDLNGTDVARKVRGLMGIWRAGARLHAGSSERALCQVLGCLTAAGFQCKTGSLLHAC